MYALPLLLGLFVLALVPTVYALGARSVAARFGRTGLAVLLPVFGVCLSALGGWRVNSVTPPLATYRPFETNPVWMISLYAAVLVIGLLPTTVRAAKTGTGEAQTFRAKQVLVEIPWFFLGLIIAMAILLVLDIAGVPFLPPASPQVPPRGAV